MLNKLESVLAGIYKGAPKLSDKAKKTITDVSPWIALILGVLQLIAAWQLWQWGHQLNRAVDVLNSYLGTSVGVPHLNVFYWVSLVVLVVDGVILLMAYQGLKSRVKAGWNLVFYGTLLSAVYGVFSAFNDYGGAGSLIIQLVVSAVVLYFLFQIRDRYSGAKSVTS